MGLARHRSYCHTPWFESALGSQTETAKAVAVEERTEETGSFVRTVKSAGRRKYTPEEKIRWLFSKRPVTWHWLVGLSAMEELNPDGVAVSRRNQHPEIPELVKKQLRDLAEREGGAVCTTNVVRHDHDLDTREMQTSQRRARSTTLNGYYAKMFERTQDNQRAQKASKRRRGGFARTKRRVDSSCRS